MPYPLNTAVASVVGVIIDVDDDSSPFQENIESDKYTVTWDTPEESPSLAMQLQLEPVIHEDSAYELEITYRVSASEKQLTVQQHSTSVSESVTTNSRTSYHDEIMFPLYGD